MSLKIEQLETAQDAAFRLRNTIVLYNEEPVYIMDVTHDEELPKGEIFRVHFHKLPYTRATQPERKFISSGRFDLAPFKLGFCNLNGQAIYMSRQSSRQNRQGLNDGTLITEPLGTAARMRGERHNIQTLIGQQGFVDMVLGKYPTIEEAVQQLEDPAITSVAVSREYALSRYEELEGLLLLNHKTKKVGFMAGAKTCKVSKKFQFLKEELEERNIPVEF